MLPSKLVGSVITAQGSQPFVLHVASGKVALGGYEDAGRHQAKLAKDVRANVERQVCAQVPAATSIKLGWFQCPKCDSWVDVAKDAMRWSGSTCRRCA